MTVTEPPCLFYFHFWVQWELRVDMEPLLGVACVRPWPMGHWELSAARSPGVLGALAARSRMGASGTNSHGALGVLGTRSHGALGVSGTHSHGALGAVSHMFPWGTGSVGHTLQVQVGFLEPCLPCGSDVS